MLKLQILDKGKTAELLIYEDIGGGWFGGITAKQVVEELQKAKDAKEINVRLNSSGGDVFEGVAIYNALRRHPASITVDVDGAALSIASVIAMAADPGQLRMSESAFMMIHNPWSVTLGGSEDHQHKARLLSDIKDQIVQIYNYRTGIEHGRLAELMNAETWMDGKQAREEKFADSLTSPLAVAARINPQVVPRLPDLVAEAVQVQAAAAKDRTDKLRSRLDKWTAGRGY